MSLDPLGPREDRCEHLDFTRRHLTYDANVSEQPNPDEPRFRDTLDDAGKAWLAEIIVAVRQGGYVELAKKFAEDEAAIEHELAERDVSS